jgi:Ca2+-binding EF-hand superfamily protein
MKKALLGLMVLAIIGWGSLQLLAADKDDKGKTPNDKGKNKQVNPGDNRDDQHSGKTDRPGDGNSGQGNDKKTDKQIPPERITQDVLIKYDKNRDGKLNDAEMAQWKADREARQKENTNKIGRKDSDKWRDSDFDNDRPWDEGWIKRIIARYDKDGDGKLNEQELAKYRADCSKHRAEFLMLKKYDKDGDGKLNAEERARMKADRTAEQEAHRLEMLKKYDKDGDGKLNDEERARMKADQAARRSENYDKFFSKWDKDGDKALNERELARYIKATHNTRRAENCDKFIKRWDKDGDGKLSPEERKTARQWYRAHPDDKDCQQWKKWDDKHPDNGVRDHGKGEGRNSHGQGKGQGQGPDNKK